MIDIQTRKYHKSFQNLMRSLLLMRVDFRIAHFYGLHFVYGFDFKQI